MKKAVLLMAYGGPDSLADIEPYLLDIRGGRPTAPELVAEIRERYAQIGGRSPLLEITCAQASALEQVLNSATADGAHLRMARHPQMAKPITGCTWACATGNPTSGMWWRKSQRMVSRVESRCAWPRTLQK